MDMGKKGLYMIQSLVFAYIATGILLCLLAFIIYQSNAGMKIANLGITLTYILASVFAGMLIGSKIGKMNMIQYSKLFYENQEDDKMKHIKTLTNKTLQNTVKKGGCGECQTSCQSACKTSCTVGNQTCEHSK